MKFINPHVDKFKVKGTKPFFSEKMYDFVKPEKEEPKRHSEQVSKSFRKLNPLNVDALQSVRSQSSECVLCRFFQRVKDLFVNQFNKI